MGYLTQSTKMGTWKQRKTQKGQRASRTPGNKKGLVPPSWARYICRANRSYKHPMYGRWSDICQGQKVKWTQS